MNCLFRALVIIAVLLISSNFSRADTGAGGLKQILASFDFTIIGVGLKASPEYQAVPRGIATKVAVDFDADNFTIPNIIEQLPDTYTIRAELSGPAFLAPVSLVTRPGVPFDIPTLAVLGRYTLTNIRLVDGNGVTLFGAVPQAVALESIPDPLITSVTTRQLTLQELQDRGVTFDKTNFTAYEFTAGIATSSGQVPLSLPVVIPTNQPLQNTPELVAPSTISLPQTAHYTTPPDIPETAIPQNLEVAPFMMEIKESFGDAKIPIPPIPGVVVIPGNIGFLHQYFSALALVSNGAPLQSGLSVRDIHASISFPPGEDLTPGTDAIPGDDPLRMAKGNDGFSLRTMPVMNSGADGMTGTADDVDILQPGESGQADFTIEGLKEGTHKIDFDIIATLDGLSVGPVTLKGKASGAVLVRNPDFTVTLGHPATVRAGEQYDLFVTVTNTGKSIANMVTVGLDPRALSGAVFVDGEPFTKSCNTLSPGSVGTVTFRLTSQRTGAVTATAFESPNVRGSFALRMGVGEKNIPLSPDSLILQYTGSLPSDLVTSAVGLLSQSWSVATAPSGALPSTVSTISKSTVTSRAYDLSEAGLRVLIGDSLVKAVADLTFDLYGSDVYNSGFDSLRRNSTKGLELNRALGGIFRTEVVASGALPFQKAFADKVSYRPAHLSIISSMAPVRLRLTDSIGNSTGALDATAADREIPYADSITISEDAVGRTNLILATRLGSSEYTLELAAEGDGTFDLGIVLPDATGVLTQYAFTGVTVTTGAEGTVTLQPGTATLLLSLDDNGDGVVDRTLFPSAATPIPDHPLHIVAATQLVHGFGPGGDKHGRNVAVLFSERVSTESAQNSANYAVEENLVKQATLQPGSRMAFLLLRDGIGPFHARSLTVQGLKDRSDKTMIIPETLPIRMTAKGPAAVVTGTVRTARGEPVPNATIRLYQLIWYDDGYTIEARNALFTEKPANADGTYRLEYVLQNDDPGGPFQVEAVNPVTGETGNLTTGVMYHGQQLMLDIFMKAKGSLSGVVRNEVGNPVGGASVQVKSLIDERYQSSTTDASGAFSFNGIMVGAYSLKAVSQATLFEGSTMGTLPEDGTAVTQDVTIRRLATVTRGTVAGKIFASDGVAPRGGPVVIIEAPSYKNWQRSASDGSYCFTDVYTGAVTVTALNETTGELSTTGGTLTDSATLFLNVIMKGTGSVTGTVKRDDGKSSAGLAVIAFFAVGAGYNAVNRVQQSDAQGGFRFDEIPIGAVSITVIDQRDFNRTVASGMITILSAGDIATIALYVPAKALASGTIKGTVYHRDGSPWANAQVRQIVDDTHYYVRVADGVGKFAIPNLALGNYRFSVGSGVEVINATADLWYDTQERTLELHPVGLGTVTGTTWDDAGKTMPTGADVTLYSVKPDLVGWLRYDTERPTVVKSDPQTGKFTFKNLFLGSFTVSSANIFRPTPVSQGGEFKADGQVVTVDLALKGAPAKPGEPLPVNQPGSVSGKVLMPDGTAAGEKVRVTITFGGADVTVTTDPQGLFKFSPIIPSGNQAIRAEEPATTLKWQGNVSVPSGLNVPITIKLLGRGALAVTVLNADGAPAADAAVSASGIDYPNESASGRSDTNGLISFANLSEGRYALAASGTFGRGGAAQAIVPGDKANVTVVVRLAASATVTGRFLKADGVTPIAGGQITLKRNGQAIAYTMSSSDPADSGRFTMAFVPLGDFNVEGYDPVTERRGMGGGRLAVDQEIVTADVVVTPRGSIKGIVLNNSGASPISGATVSISVNGMTGFNFTSVTAPDGTFFFSGVPAGRFTVDAADPTNGLHGLMTGSLSYENENVSTQVRIAPTGSIAGRVLQTNGVNRAAAALVLLNGKQQQQVDAQTGAFRYDNLTAGHSYTITATLPPTRRAGSTIATITRDLEVANGDIILGGLGIVTGTVFETDGTTILPGARVELRFGAETLIAYSANDGGFNFPDITTGDFTLTASHPERTTGTSRSGTLLSEGHVATVNLVLGPVASVKATVLLADGSTPSRGGGISLSADGRAYTGITDSNGQYTFTGIPVPCTFSLYVEDATGVGIGTARGNLTRNGEILDVGTIVLDDKPIFVIAVNPATGAVAVPVDQVIRVLFSEPATPETLKPEHIYLTQGGVSVSGILTPDADNQGITFKPSGPLSGFTLYTLVVKDRITDRVGRKLALPQSVSFTTIDNIPPIVTAISPTNGTIQVAPDSVVRVSFDEALDALSLTGVTLSSGVTAIPVKVDLIQNGTVVVLTPLAPLDYNRSYTLAASGVRDLVGNVLVDTAHATFSTIDTLAPAITSLVIPAGSELIKGTSLKLTAIVAESDVARVDFFVEEQFVGSVTKSPFTLPVILPKDGLVHLKAIAQDNTGNRGVAAFLDIQVGQSQAPVVTIISPDAGSTITTGAAFTVTLQGSDDLGVKAFTLSASGAVTTNQTRTVTVGKVVTTSFTLIAPVGMSQDATVTLTAVATDSSGISSQPVQRTLLLQDKSAPTLSLAPGRSVRYRPGETATVLITAGDNVGVAAIACTAANAATGSLNLVLTPAAVSSTHSFTFSIPADAAPHATVSVTCIATDASGNSKSDTIVLTVADTVPPTILSISPADNSLTIPVGTMIAVSFNEPIDPASVTTGMVTLASPSGPAAGSVSVADDGLTLTFKPYNQLGASRVYSFTLKAGVRDVSGNAITDDVTISFTTQSPDTGLVGYWPMDGDWQDASGKGKHGTAANGATFSSDHMVGTQAGSFRSGSSYVSIGNLYGNFPDNAFSMEAWVKLDDTGNGGRRTIAGGVGSYADYALGIIENQFTVYTYNGSVGYYAKSGFTPEVDRWYHVAGAFDGKRMKLYVDGELQSDIPAVWRQTGLEFRIGNEACCGNNINGLIDDVALYHRALMAEDVFEQYNAGLTTNRTPPAAPTVEPVAAATDNSTILLRGTKDSGTSIRVNGKQVVAHDSTTTWQTLYPISLGQNLLDITSRDRAGNTSDVITVAVDMLPANPDKLGSVKPFVTLTSPGQTTRYMPGETGSATVTVTNDQDVVTLYCNAAGAASAGTQAIPYDPLKTRFTFTVAADALPSAPLHISCIAGTISGVYGSAVLEMMVDDRVTPHVMIVSPNADSSINTGASFAVTLQATDESALQEVTLTASGEISFAETKTITSGKRATAIFTLTAPSALSGAGAIVLTVTARDVSGNVSPPATRTLLLHDSITPVITLTSPGQTIKFKPGETAVVTVAVSDNMGANQIACSAVGSATATQTFDPAPQSSETHVFSFTVPPGALPYAVITVACTATDAAGNIASASLNLTVADVVPPIVVSATPADGATNVPTNAALTFSFSEPFNPATVTDATVTLTESVSGAVIPTSVTHSGDRQSVTVRPSSPLTAGVGYTLTVTTAVSDAAGNGLVTPYIVHFVGDDNPPVVAAVTPAAGSINVPVGSAISVRFAERIDPTSVTIDLVALTSSSGPPVPGALTVAGDGLSLTFKPYNQLGYNHVYTFTLKAGVRDISGNATITDLTVAFITLGPDSDLVGYWPMDGDWSDYSGNGNHGTSAGAIFTSDHVVGTQAGGFNGKSYVQVMMNVPEYNFTVEAWVKSGLSGGVFSIAAGSYEGSNGHDRHMYINNDGFACFRVWQGSGWCTARKVNDSIWHHWALVVESGVGQMAYIDGKMAGSNPYDHSDFNMQDRIVIGYSADSGFLNGMIDEVLIYKRAMLSEDILEQYNAGLTDDRIPPKAPTVDPLPSQTFSTQIILRGTKEAGASVRVNGKQIVTHDATTTWQALFQLSLGQNLLNVSSHDLAGNVSPSVNLIVNLLPMNQKDPTIAGLWHFDGDWKDYSGNGNDGTANNGATFSPDGRMGSGSARFDGIDDYISGLTAHFPIGSTARTLSAWVRTSDSNGDMSILHFGTPASASPPQNYHLVLTGGKAAIGNGYGYGVVTGTTNIADGRWHHIAGIYDGPATNLARIYVDGELQNSGTITTPATTNQSFTSGKFLGGAGQFNTSLDELAVYSRALSAQEVLELYNSSPSIVLTSPGHSTKYKPGEIGTGTVTATNPNGIIKLYCNVSGAASEGTLVVPFDPPQTDVTRQLTFRVATDAGPNEPYRLSCTAETVAGAFGTVNLNLQSADVVPATVTNASIANNATGVMATVPIIVTFNETMEAASITGDTVQLRRFDTGAMVAGSSVLAPDGKTLTFTPAGALECTVDYQFVIHGVLDLAGNSSDYSINFATQSLTSPLIENKGTSTVPYVLASGRYGVVKIRSSFVVLDGQVAADSMSVSMNSTITLKPTGLNGAERLYLVVTGALTIDATSRIDVTGRGYPGAYQGGNGNAGRTNGNTATGGSTNYSGGSYGGYGGYYGGTVNTLYGDLLNPNESGSGGGGDSYNPGGNGGGLVRITAGAITLDGSIVADGQTAPSGYYGGGGSGGGIRIDAGTLSGAGVIQARGGSSPNSRGSGGGGRIAIYHGAMTLLQTNVSASGAATSYPGGAGTVYLKSTTLGTDHLIVDNREVNTGEGSTQLRSMGSGVVSDVTADTLTASGTSWQPGALKGMKFAPDVTQNRYFTVIDNDVTSVRIDPAEGDLTRFTARGSAFSGVYAFTWVSILGKGRLTSLDRLAVSDEVLVDGSTLVTTALSAVRLTLRNGGLLSQWRTTTSREYLLDLSVDALSIDTSSRIDVTGRGYLGAYQGGNGNAGRTNGNTATGGSTNYSGGSYGGYGGYYGGTVNTLYGDLLNPNESGSGGGGDSYNPGGNGGGLVRITAGAITLDGSIVADGQTAPSGYYGGGGGGGGIRIDAGALSGAGVIQARGGSSPNSRGSGGGGRIAIYHGAMTLPQANVSASGAATSYPGGAGTIYLKSDSAAHGDIVVSAAGRKDKVTILPSGTYGTISVTNSTLITDGAVHAATVVLNNAVFQATALTADTVTLTSNSVLTHPSASITAESYLDLTVTGTLSIDSSSRIDVTGRGYSGAYQGGNGNVGRTNGNTATGGSTSYSGGSYGGSGGNYGGTVNTLYGDLLNPNESGSGGGGDSYNPGGNGGGLVRITAGAITLDGSIVADGQTAPSGYYGGGGSGGGIRIDAGTLSGAGVIQARGGSSPNSRGSGGGGRIAIYHGAMTLPQANVIASGAATSYPGGAGTVYLKATTLGTDHLIVDNREVNTGEGSTYLCALGSGVVSGVTTDTLTASGTNWQPGALKGLRFTPDVTQSRYFTVIDNDVTSVRIDPAEGDLSRFTARGATFSGVYVFTKFSVLGKGRLTSLDRLAVSDEVLVDGSTLVTTALSADRLTLRSGGLLSQWRTTTSREYLLDLLVDVLSIDATSRIDVTGRGYLGAYQGGNGSLGRTNGNTATGGSTSYSGGSYGGSGGYYGGTVNTLYGDPLNPNESGSGGGGDSYNPGGTGGGLVRITAGAITLDGSIVADGQTAPSGYYGGGGSGGGIRIDVGALSGAGVIQARGGGSPNNRGRGGGGRIAIYSDMLTLPAANVTASGGGGLYSGANGSVYVSP